MNIDPTENRRFTLNEVHTLLPTIKQALHLVLEKRSRGDAAVIRNQVTTYLQASEHDPPELMYDNHLDGYFLRVHIEFVLDRRRPWAGDNLVSLSFVESLDHLFCSTYQTAMANLLWAFDNHLERGYYSTTRASLDYVNVQVWALIERLALITGVNSLPPLSYNEDVDRFRRWYVDFGQLEHSREIHREYEGRFDLDDTNPDGNPNNGLGWNFEPYSVTIDSSASKRARQLLLENLDKKQKKDYTKNRQFKVIGSLGGKYTITHKNQINVIDAAGNALCVVTRDLVPTEDLLLVQKLLIETDEDEFLRVAINWGKRSSSSYSYANLSPRRGGGYDLSFVSSAPGF